MRRSVPSAEDPLPARRGLERAAFGRWRGLSLLGAALVVCLDIVDHDGESSSGTHIEAVPTPQAEVKNQGLSAVAIGGLAAIVRANFGAISSLAASSRTLRAASGIPAKD